MNFIVWLIFGAIAGWLASVVMKTDESQGSMGDIVLGIVGSIVGGFVFNLFGEPGVTGFNLYSFLVSLTGSAIVIFIGRAMRSRV